MDNTSNVKFDNALLKKLRTGSFQSGKQPYDVDIAGTNIDLSTQPPQQSEGYLSQSGMNVANNRDAFSKQAPNLNPTTAIKTFKTQNTATPMAGQISSSGVVTKAPAMSGTIASSLQGTTNAKVGATSGDKNNGVYGADLIKMSEDDMTKSILKMEQQQKDRESMANESDKTRTLKAGEESLNSFRNLIGLDASGNVDMSKTGSIGASLKNDFDKYQTEQNKLNTQYESARRGRVVGQMRANLLSRGIDISRLPQEKLIALSDEVGAKAFSDIYENKERVINNINSKQEALTSRLNDLREKGVLAEDKYRTLTATVNSQFEKTKNDILDKYKDTVLGVVQTGKQRDEAVKTGAINTLESLLSKAMPNDVPELRQKYMSQISSGKVTSSDLVAGISKDPSFKKSVKELADKLQKVAERKGMIESEDKLAGIKLKYAQAIKASSPVKSSGAKAKSPSMPSVSDIEAAARLGIPSIGLTKSQLTQKIAESLSK